MRFHAHLIQFYSYYIKLNNLMKSVPFGSARYCITVNLFHAIRVTIHPMLLYVGIYRYTFYYTF